MNGRRPALSGYRILWLLVMFDLPVVTKAERRHATGFRHALQDQGFQMSQFSVYARHCAGKEAAERYIKEVERALPPRRRGPYPDLYRPAVREHEDLQGKKA